MFQFLIGTIKTRMIQQGWERVAEVSIPYRYDKNERPHTLPCRLAAVSIPYRYDKNDSLKPG